MRWYPLLDPADVYLSWDSLLSESKIAGTDLYKNVSTVDGRIARRGLAHRDDRG